MDTRSACALLTVGDEKEMGAACPVARRLLGTLVAAGCGGFGVGGEQ